MADEFTVCDQTALQFDDTKDDAAVGENFSTSWAVTQFTWADAVQRGIVPNKPLSQATFADCQNIRRVQFWNAMRCDLLQPGCDLMVYYTGIGCGPGHSVRLAQRIAGVAEDGVLGPITALAIKGMGAAAFIKAAAIADDEYYESLANAPTYVHGWERGEGIIEAAANKMAGITA